MFSYKCSKCGSQNINVINEDFGKCLDCGAKFILEDLDTVDDRVKCPKCNSVDVTVIDGGFAKCNVCGKKFIIEDEDDALSEPEQKSEDVAATAIQPKSKNVAIQCDKCGSTDVEVIGEDMAICKHCHTKIILNAGKKVVTNVVNNVTINGGDKNDFKAFAVERTTKSEDFFRDAIIRRYAQKTVPVDFIDRNFEPVKSEYETYFRAACDVNLTYSANIGFKRQEKYKQWNNTAGRYEEKTRTVIDWQPFSGSDSGEVKKFYRVGGNGDAFLLTNHKVNDSDGSLNMQEYDSATFEKGELIVPEQSDIDRAKRSSIAAVGTRCEENLPGDVHENYTYNGLATVNNIEVYSVPTYSFGYEKDYEKYKISGFAFGKIEAFGDIESDEHSLEDTLNKKTGVLFGCAVTASILSIIFSIIFGMVIFCKPLVYLAICLAATVDIAYLIARSSAKKDMYNSRQKEKLNKLSDFLSEKGLKPLTNEEQSLFGVAE